MTDLQISLTPEQLDSAVAQKRPTFEPFPEGEHPAVVTSLTPTTSKSSGAYMLKVRLVPLGDADDVTTADDKRSAFYWVPLPIPNPNTGFEPPSESRKLSFAQKRVRTLITALGYTPGEWPRWDPDSKSWSLNDEPLDQSEADKIRSDTMREVIGTAVALFNSEEERDNIVSQQNVLRIYAEHEERTWEKNGEEVTSTQANIKSLRAW